MNPPTPASSSNSAKTLLRGTSITALLTVLSRILGFVRDLLVARLFGAGPIADAFFVAFRIPNLLRSFVAEGALTAAFVPVFASELQTGTAKAAYTLRVVTSFLLLLTGVLSILGVVYASTIVSLFAPGFTDELGKAELCIELTAIMFPYVICVSLIAMVNGALNSVHRYGASAWAQVVMNLVLIVGAIVAGYLPAIDAARVLSWSVLVGGVVQVLVQIPALKAEGFSLRPALQIWSPATAQIVRLMLPATVGAAIYQTTVFLSTLLASFAVPGSVSWLFYADRITQLPIGIFSVALASVLLPVLARERSAGNAEGFARSLENSLRYSSFILIPFSAWLVAVAEPLVVLLFQRGAFDAHSSQMTALAVQGLSLGLWAASCHSMLTRAFIAQKDTVTPTVLGALSLLINVGLSLILMGPLLHTRDGVIFTTLSAVQQGLVSTFGGVALGHLGLALASAMSSLTAFSLVLLLAMRRVSHFQLAIFFGATVRAALASAVMVLGIWQLQRFSLSPFMFVGCSVAVGALFYGGASFALRSHELTEFLRVVASRLPGRVRAS